MRHALLLLPLILTACGVKQWQARFGTPDEAADLQQGGESFVKLHQLDGGVVVLADGWAWDPGANTITGQGVSYDDRRNLVKRGNFTVAAADLVLVETTHPYRLRDATVPVMGVVTGASLLVTAICATNPKACFGSCPTFYAETADGLALQAEGFSDAIAAPLENADVDALWTALAPDGPLALVLTNEALETHYLRSVEVLAVPRPAGGRALRHGDRFLAASALHPPTACTWDGADCLAAVAAVDEDTWIAPADPEDLAVTAAIEVTLPPAEGPAAVVVAGRQGLLTTFVLYQMLAWMGPDAGSVVATLTRDGADLARRAVADHPLERLRVDVWDGAAWAAVGHVREVGPIAREVQAFPLPDGLPAGPVRVRLSGAAGGWRVDHVGLAAITGEVQPVAVPVAEVLGPDGAPDPRALAALRDPDTHFVTWPGDRYTLRFELPEGEHELLLRSRGYYLEWMRDEWLKEHDPARVIAAIRDPDEALRRLAPAWKAIEPDAEQIFWDSRVELGVVPVGAP